MKIFASLKCKSPTPVDIIYARERLEKRNNISGITDLVMQNSNITTLYPGTFDFHTFLQIEKLYLSNNSISTLPENLFDSLALSSLQELNLRHNLLKYLSSKHFVTLENLQNLDLSYNKFTVFLPGLFMSNPIEYLDLRMNYIDLLPDDFLAGNVSITLKNLYLEKNHLSKIPNCLFQKNSSDTTLPNLEVLFLGRNKIKELPTGLFNSTNWSSLKHLYLNRNNIYSLHPTIFNSVFLQNLRKIDLSRNKITVLPDELFQSSHLQNLLEIRLSYNQIRFIPAKFLKNKALENLNSVFLNNNKIRSVTEDLLPNKLRRFLCLDLANNIISSLGQIIPKVLFNMNCNGKIKLFCRLNFSNNRITVQTTNFIQPKNDISVNGYLDLSHNNISKFEEMSDFTYQKKFLHVSIPLGSRWLNISGNQIFSIVNLVNSSLEIDLNHVDNCLCSFITNVHLIRLHLLIQEFPYDYDCNCDMDKYLKLQNFSYFRKAIQNYIEYIHKVTPWYLILTSANLINNLRCGSPEHLKGKYLHQLKRTDLQCEKSCVESMGQKQCTCIETPYNSTLKINCTAQKLKAMPFIKQNFSNVEIYMGFNKMQILPFVKISVSIYVILLDLSYNYIINIPKRFFLITQTWYT